MKVSFDYDGTLSLYGVQEYAQELINNGVEVWVTTTRYDDAHLHNYDDTLMATNQDLWDVVDKLGIPRERVTFTNMVWKYEYLMGSDFVWHLDNNEDEMAEPCDIPMVLFEVHDIGYDWKIICEGLLKKHQTLTE